MRPSQPFDQPSNGLGLGLFVPALLEIEVVHDAAEAADRCALRDREGVCERLERAPLASMGELHAKHVERNRLTGPGRPIGEIEPRLVVDEAPDQPRARDAIDAWPRPRQPRPSTVIRNLQRISACGGTDRAARCFEIAQRLLDDDDDEAAREELVARLQCALKWLQNMDPLGVGARNLGECLTLQLRALPRSEAQMIAIIICKQHLDLLARRDVKKLMAATGADEALLKEAQALIASLEPKPARPFARAERVCSASTRLSWTPLALPAKGVRRIESGTWW